jgi:hypothetical protein
LDLYYLWDQLVLLNPSALFGPFVLLVLLVLLVLSNPLTLSVLSDLYHLWDQLARLVHLALSVR